MYPVIHERDYMREMKGELTRTAQTEISKCTLSQRLCFHLISHTHISQNQTLDISPICSGLAANCKYRLLHCVGEDRALHHNS